MIMILRDDGYSCFFNYDYYVDMTVIIIDMASLPALQAGLAVL